MVDSQTLEKCENSIGYVFKDRALLERALTHASLRKESGTCNERLEFLGDAVLGLVVSDFLFHTFRDFDEGDLSLIKSIVVSRATLAKQARVLRLPDFFSFANPNKEEKGNKIPNSVLANVFEAIIGAIYIDSGLAESRKFILASLRNDIESAIKNPYQKNYKTLLQFIAQKYLGTTPSYKILGMKGANHEKVFIACAIIGKRKFLAAEGPNKKEAEQLAAHAALQILSLEDPVIAENIRRNLSVDDNKKNKPLAKTPSLFHNSKSLLQHVTQKNKLPYPEYKRIHIEIENERKFFYIAVQIGGRRFPEAKATKVKEAERLAARNALDILAEDYAKTGVNSDLTFFPMEYINNPPLWHKLN